MLIRIAFILVVFVTADFVTADCFAGEPSQVTIDCDYPGGNIILDRIDKDTVFVHQNLKNTRGDWFYWNFRVRGAKGRKLTFAFTKNDVLSTRGPAFSLDQGKSWKWLGQAAVTKNSFTFDFKKNETVRFCFSIPYQQQNLDQFLKQYKKSMHLRREVLCKSKKKRDVVRLHVGNLTAQPKHRVLITCRHHACEMIASYAVEGIVTEILSNTNEGKWLRDNAEFLIIPIMDLDGVEEGEQGKNRTPRDHNRDYKGASIHPEVKALREYVPKWSKGKFHFALDLHNPGRKGGINEHIYLVENEGASGIAARNFAAILETAQTGSLPFRADDNLPFGKGWNVPKTYKQGMMFGKWASLQPDVVFAATLEIPYANVRKKTVTAKSTRLLGRDLARSIRIYLEKTNFDKAIKN